MNTTKIETERNNTREANQLVETSTSNKRVIGLHEVYIDNRLERINLPVSEIVELGSFIPKIESKQIQLIFSRDNTRIVFTHRVFGTKYDGRRKNSCKVLTGQEINNILNMLIA